LENNDTDIGRECVICMTEPRDTTVLPCRHMCLCSGCADLLRHQSNKCPICRSTVKSMIEIKISKGETCKIDEDAVEEELTLMTKKEKRLAKIDEEKQV